jgi:ankyrin repeat protein
MSSPRPLTLHHLASAIEQNEISKVESLLANNAVDANWRMPRDDNPPALVLAAFCGRAEIAELLLNAGARINDIDDQCETACHAAVLGNHPDVLAVLLPHLPDLTRLDCSARTPLRAAFEMRRILQHRDVDTLLVSLLLIEAGAPLDQLSTLPLSRFAAHSTRAIRALIARGVVLSQLQDDSTPLVAAGKYSTDTDVAAMLVNKLGCDLNALSPSGESCTYAAASEGNLPLLRWFVTHGAEVNATIHSDYNPLHGAVSSFRYEATLCLLAAGANPNLLDAMNRTPVQMAAYFPILEGTQTLIMQALVASGADLDVEELDGRTARQRMIELEIAIDADALEIARRNIAKTQLDFVRQRAMQVCIGLQSRGLDALQLCEILQFACGPMAQFIDFHKWWKIATTVKHFKK